MLNYTGLPHVNNNWEQYLKQIQFDDMDQEKKKKDELIFKK